MVLGILGCGYCGRRNYIFITRDESIKSSEESERDGKKGTDVVTYTSVTEDENQSNLNNVKADVAKTMRERHEEAQRK